MTSVHLPHYSPGTQVTAQIADGQSVLAALLSRFSCRAFTQQAVPRELLQAILQTAQRAPSGSNTQPWRTYVLQGAKRDAIITDVCAAYDSLAKNPELHKNYPEPYDYYPKEWFSPYMDRRRACGFSLYSTLGIEKGDHAKMFAQHRQNYRFFDAPVGLMFTMDKNMGRGSLIDYGMYLQSIMLAARAFGLHTCPQAAWNKFASVILPHLGAGEQEMLICTIALGYADEQALVNTFQTVREPLEDTVRWLE